MIDSRRGEILIKLSKEKKEKMIYEIKKYFLEERDEDLGDLASDIVLDFFMEKLAPEIYNQGIQDAYGFMKDRMEDVLELEKY